MFCIIDGGNTGPGGNCSPEELRNRDIDRSALSDEDVDKIVKDFKEKPNAQLGQVLTTRLLEKIMSQQAARATISTIPVAGQVYLAVVVIDMMDRMDGFIEDNGLSKMAADLNSRQYLEYYTIMRSANDEMKAGVLSMDEVGAVMSDFDGAEQSRVYQAYASPKSSTASIFSSKALAAEANYKCADGKPLAKGELVCPEKKVTRTFKIEDVRNNGLVDGLVETLNVYGKCHGAEVKGNCVGIRPQTFIRPLLDGINKVSDTVVSPVVGLIFDGIKHIKYVGDIISYAERKFGEIIQAFMGKVFPLPVKITDPGREKYDALEAGGEVAASEFAKGGYTESGQAYGLGGKLLSAQEQTSIWQNYLDQQDYEFKNSSFLAKLTNLEYPNSITSRFVTSMPASFNQVGQKLGVLLRNPFGNFSLSPSANAATNLVNSPFGVPRFGYPDGDPALTRDPAELTEEYCQAAKIAWQNSKSEDPVTGFEHYATTNPCLLEQVAVEAAASVFLGDDSLDDGLNNTTQTDEDPTVSGDASQIAKQILDTRSIDLRESNFCRYCLEDIRNTAEGRPAFGNVHIDVNLLKFLLHLGRLTKVDVNSITGAGSGHSPTSNHYRGTAIDFGCSLDVEVADSIGSKYGITRYSGERCPDDGHWHYSTTGD
jgi:hypothetical protein